MSKRKQDAAQAVADRLIAAEIGIDDALSLAADLSAFMPKARKSAFLAAEVGQEAMELASEAMQHLVRARASIVATHQKLAEVRDDIGLSTVNFGSLYGKPVKASVVNLVDRIAA